MKRFGFTLIEVLIVVIILSIIMAIALPLYARSVRESQRQTCRGNMQAIAHAEQTYKINSRQHKYTEDLTKLVGATQDLLALPRCPSDSGAVATDDYRARANRDGTITIRCNSDDLVAAGEHNTVKDTADHGFTPGTDAE